MMQPFTLGVNYWPRRKAMYWWQSVDRDEVFEEFALIRDLGMNLVRIFLLWDDWQPTPDQVSTTCLHGLETVCQAAADHGLLLDVTFFTGHMSGPNWAPGWMLHGEPRPGARQLVSGGKVVQRGYRNPFADPQSLAAERLLLSTVVQTFQHHPAIGMWNLGNEPDLFAWPEHDQQGQEWVRSHVSLIKQIDPVHPVTCGLHADSLMFHNHLRADQVFAETDLAVMHAYPMYLPWSRGPLDPDLVPFSCALTSALCGKPTMMEEFGGCSAPPGEASQTWTWTAYGEPRSQFMASEEDLAQYVAEVLPRLVKVGSTGAVLWCFADYAPELWDRPPCDESRHERHFGLVRPDGSLKPHAEVIRKFAASQPMVKAEGWKDYLADVDGDDYYRDPQALLRQLYQDFYA